jgi:hypothetical protein
MVIGYESGTILKEIVVECLGMVIPKIWLRKPNKSQSGQPVYGRNASQTSYRWANQLDAIYVCTYVWQRPMSVCLYVGGCICGSVGGKE